MIANGRKLFQTNDLTIERIFSIFVNKEIRKKYPFTHSLDTIILLNRPKNNLSKKESRKWRNGGVPMA